MTVEHVLITLAKFPRDSPRGTLRSLEEVVQYRAKEKSQAKWDFVRSPYPTYPFINKKQKTTRPPPCLKSNALCLALKAN